MARGGGIGTHALLLSQTAGAAKARSAMPSGARASSDEGKS